MRSVFHRNFRFYIFLSASQKFKFHISCRKQRKVKEVNQKVNKFSNYVFFVVFISIFLEMKFPIFHWLSLFGMVIMYGLNLVKEKSIKGKIHPGINHFMPDGNQLGVHKTLCEVRISLPFMDRWLFTDISSIHSGRC